MTPWWQQRMVAFDLETTGVDPATARVVTAAVLKVGGGGPTETTLWLVDPGVDIPAEATAVHGITTEQARAGGDPAASTVPAIVDALSDAWLAGLPVVIFNAAYDLTVLAYELDRYDLPPLGALCPPAPVIDPMVVDRHVDRYRKGKRTLSACCEHYDVRLEEAHAAHGDAVAAARLAWRIAQRHPDAVGDVPAAGLHDLQVAWHGEWAAGFEAYLRKSDPGACVDRDWPCRPLVAGTVR